MKTNQKETFFETLILPTGQMIELVLAHIAPHYRAKYGVLMQEPLNKVAAFVLHPETPAQALASLASPLVAVMGYLRNLLSSVNHAEPTASSVDVFIQQVENMQKVAGPLFANLEKAVGYHGGNATVWHSRYTPPFAKYAKWRTFVRNINFEENMKQLKLDDALRAFAEMGQIGSRTGREKAPELWDAIFQNEGSDLKSALAKLFQVRKPGTIQVPAGFDGLSVLEKLAQSTGGKTGREIWNALMGSDAPLSPPKASEQKPAASGPAQRPATAPQPVSSSPRQFEAVPSAATPAIPDGITIRMVANGMLEVKAEFDVRPHIKTLEFAHELNLRFNAQHPPMSMAVQCSYIQLPTVVNGLNEKIQGVKNFIPAIQREYDSYTQGYQEAQLEKKFASLLSPEERALFAKMYRKAA